MTNDHQATLAMLGHHMTTATGNAFDAALYGPEALCRTARGDEKTPIKETLTRNVSLVLRDIATLAAAGVIDLSGYHLPKIEGMGE